jgi:hypothetical protein
VLCCLSRITRRPVVGGPVAYRPLCRASEGRVSEALLPGVALGGYRLLEERPDLLGAWDAEDREKVQAAMQQAIHDRYERDD